MKTWLKILIIIFVIIILFYIISFILLTTKPFISYNEKFQYSKTKNILCKFQNSRIRHHCEIPCNEYKNLEGRIKADCWSCNPENRYPEERCEIMNYGESCNPDIKWYKYSMCEAPKLA